MHPQIISLVHRRFEDGDWSGVPRFDWELRKIFPNLISLKYNFWSLCYLYLIQLFNPKTIVITGNELSIHVPNKLKTIVVHHGCAQTHFDRDPEWRGPTEKAFCVAQKKMYTKKNRHFVSPSEWTSKEFSAHYNVPKAQIIPHWVTPILPVQNTDKPVIILGDWRSFNKGQHIIEKLQKEKPNWTFQALKCTYDTREDFYKNASAYLCLSLSEGGSYALSDAEAARLPIVTTNVGNYLEYNCHTIPYDQRENIELIITTLQNALDQPKDHCFFDSYTYEDWKTNWLNYIDTVSKQI